MISLHILSHIHFFYFHNPDLAMELSLILGKVNNYVSRNKNNLLLAP